MAWLPYPLAKLWQETETFHRRASKNCSWGSWEKNSHYYRG